MIEAPVTPKMPWELLYPKQLQLFNTGLELDCRDIHPSCPPAILCEGPRKTSKSIGCCHRVIRHMVDTVSARAALIVRTTGSATDGGVWNDLTEIVLPTWFEANCTEFTSIDRRGNPGPKIDAKTRTIYFKIRNRYGGESELRLIPINHDDEVKPRLRSTRFSCIYFSELSNFHDARVFTGSWEQLRMFHLQPWQHLWLADTNPSDEGKDSWIYKLWFEKKISMNTDTRGGQEFLASLRRLHFALADNLSMTQTEREARLLLYADDEGELQREYYGNWTKGHGYKGKHFADIFSRDVHVIGDEKQSIELDPTTVDLFTGWDIGDVNHGAGIIERRYVKSADGTTEWSVWSIIDSILHTDEHISIGELGIEMTELMDNLHKQYGRDFRWTHYSDDSALTVYRPSSQSFDYQEIQVATNGRIELEGVSKPANSIRTRVQLVRKLIRMKRLFVSGKCNDVIEMFEGLRKGSTKDQYIEKGSVHKHVFDWISYVLYMELSDEMDHFSRRPAPRADGIVPPSSLHIRLG